MYYNGQIVYDRAAKKPVKVGDDSGTDWAWSGIPRRTTHFIEDTGKFTREHSFMKIALPKSIEEAEDLLERGLISPAPVSPTHCWKCGNWKSNHPSKTCDLNADGGLA